MLGATYWADLFNCYWKITTNLLDLSKQAESVYFAILVGIHEPEIRASKLESAGLFWTMATVEDSTRMLEQS